MSQRLWQHGDQYRGPHLDPEGCPDDPLVLFRDWFDEADRAQPGLANPMTLATLGADGRPVARMVLLKEVDDRGFVFSATTAVARVRIWPRTRSRPCASTGRPSIGRSGSRARSSG